MLKDLLYKEEVFEIVGAAMQVYNSLGPGFLEAVYQEAFEIELSNRSIKFKPQQGISIYYGGKRLEAKYIADFLIDDKIIVEIKAIKKTTNIEEAQIINYLKASSLQLGLLINFGAVGKLEWKRIVKTTQVSRSKSV